eukprot:335554-Chlamydomonas_euryale.AAC.5
MRYAGSKLCGTHHHLDKANPLFSICHTVTYTEVRAVLRAAPPAMQRAHTALQSNTPRKQRHSARSL